MEKLSKKVTNLEESRRGWDEFAYFLWEQSPSDESACSIGMKPENRRRNRYINVFPVNETLVHLKEPGNGNDYIHANHVKVKSINRQYILAQGPVNGTCGDFWQMVWEQNVPAIVMLNQAKELCKEEIYWPIDEQQSPVTHGNFSIFLRKSEKKPAHIRSEFEVVHLQKKDEKARTVLHFHFLGWPDYGVPRKPNDLLIFRNEVKKSGLMDSKEGPCIIHCLGGIGRTGTFCFMETVLAMAEKKGSLDSIDIENTLLKLRAQRHYLVQTPEQLRLAYLGILEGCKQLTKDD